VEDVGKLACMMGCRVALLTIVNKERTIEELISFFIHSLYSWTAAYLAPLGISYNDFLVLLSSSF